MKSLKSLTTIVFLSALLLQVSFANADEVERTLAQKKFDVSSDALLSVEHKFGKIKCKNWDQNSISVKVTASVEASSVEKANKLLDRISVDVDGNSNAVSVESKFSDKLFSGKNNNLTIDIEIMMPESVRLDIDHQFGNAYIEVADGDSEISIQYGSLEVKALKSNSNDIEVSFSEANLDYVGKGDLDISYSTLKVEEGLDLNIESDYSTVTISKVDNLKIENEGGNVNIGEIGSVDLTSKFSEFKISKLHNLMIADTEYGSLKVWDIEAGFSQIIVENSFGSVNLEFMNDASFNLEADMEFCDLNYPKSSASFSKRIVESTEKYYQGTIGSGSSKSSVSIESSFGNVSIDM